MFDFLTLSVVIDDRIFCVHGGEFYYWFGVTLRELFHSQDYLRLYIPLTKSKLWIGFEVGTSKNFVITPHRLSFTLVLLDRNTSRRSHG